MWTPDVLCSRILRTPLIVTLGLLAFILLVGGCTTEVREPAPPPPLPTLTSSSPPLPPPSAPPADEEPTAAESAPASEEVGVVEVNSDNFAQEVLNAETLVVVDFWAVWCVPCQSVKPILAELAQYYAGKVKFTSLDVDESPPLPKEYEIRGIPSLIFFKDGEEIDRLEGLLLDKEAYRAEIDKRLSLDE